ncbi:restriction endonuclease subunit S [Acinetobacter venetianus]|uniref:restriction endonuclease subunit S n=1 Tax=Acinetobacter venetianus TaxID=52133 RepID=UPI0003663CAB|nr:restriction endonuclease subunit S [Acinetobacter venetianus]
MIEKSTKALGSICKIINGRAYKQNELLDEGKYKVLRVGNFFSNSSWYYSDLELEDSKYCNNGDLLFAWSASFGPKIWTHDKTIFHYHIWKMEEDKKFIDKHYLYYYLLNSVQSMMASTHGSIMLHLTKDFMEKMLITFPTDVEYQKRVVKILVDIDKKIDINEKLISNLVSVATTTYQFWFEHFEFPDENGKPYKSSLGKMKFSEILDKNIPETWEVGSLSELFLFNPKLSVKKGEIASYIDMDALPLKGFMTKKALKKAYSGGMKFQKNDIAVARITPCLENGKTALFTRLNDEEIAFGSTEFIILRGRENPIPYFGACLARSETFRSFAISNMTGTSGRKRIDHKVLSALVVPLPSKDLLIKFETAMEPIFKKMDSLTNINQSLLELRNWLLPMLMNGQISIRDAEEHIVKTFEQNE